MRQPFQTSYNYYSEAVRTELQVITCAQLQGLSGLTHLAHIKACLLDMNRVWCLTETCTLLSQLAHTDNQAFDIFTVS